MTEQTCAERITDYMAGRAETIKALQVAEDDCQYVFDGRDTDDNYGKDDGGTPYYQCETHGDTVAGSTDEDGNLYPPDVTCGRWRTDEDGNYLGDGSEYSARETAEERLAEMPLSVEIIRSVKILLGWGGPSDWLMAELDSEGDIRSLTYHFADWFDHAAQPVEQDSPLWRFAETFVEFAAVEL